MNLKSYAPAFYFLLFCFHCSLGIKSSEKNAKFENLRRFEVFNIQKPSHELLLISNDDRYFANAAQ